MKKLLCAAAILLSIQAHNAFAQQTQYPDLKSMPPNRQVQSVSYCNGVYSVTLKDGNSLKEVEFNLRFKTDSSANGPKPGSPAMLPSGMSGDRAFLIFAGPAEISTFIKLEC